MRYWNWEFSNFTLVTYLNWCLYGDRCDVCVYIYTVILLQLCVILEPMQELMSRHKAYALSPRDCLKTTLFQKWQRIVAPPGKRGRRTVALHEKHQPVDAEQPLILIDNVKSVFAIRGTAHDNPLSSIFFIALCRNSWFHRFFLIEYETCRFCVWNL